MISARTQPRGECLHSWRIDRQSTLLCVGSCTNPSASLESVQRIELDTDRSAKVSWSKPQPSSVPGLASVAKRAWLPACLMGGTWRYDKKYRPVNSSSFTTAVFLALTYRLPTFVLSAPQRMEYSSTLCRCVPEKTINSPSFCALGRSGVIPSRDVPRSCWLQIKITRRWSGISGAGD